MSKHLIVCGHGAGDPGAGGNGYQEDTFNRNIMRPLIQKWASQLKNNQIEFYDINRNMYVDTQNGGGAYNTKGYASVTELHLDAAGSSATGGHVIICAGLTPDAADLAIGALINKYVGLWGSSKPTGVFGRDNLLNLNVCAQIGVSYRLVEWGFISNATDVNNLLANKDAIAKGLVEAITGESLSGSATVAAKPTPENPVKACLDVVNLNSQAFQIKGWLLNKQKDLKSTVPFLFFTDEEGREITRFKGKWTSRKDVEKVFANPSGDMVGVVFDGQTPAKLNTGGKYRIMLRASDDKGNVSYAENWFDSNFAQNPKIDTGNLDLFKLENGKLRVAGWHLATNQKQVDHHFIFIMDRETNKEITRYDITANSFNQSDDVKKAFNNNQIAQASKCRFDALVDVKDVLKNKSVYVMSRYCYDPLGNDGVSAQYSFKDTVIFI
ncbi:N-acetylmuramoyl-L-alanine amidase [Enterococcus sp. AZ102]|uniref:N-acetylmuramoyl-L-alanine amidase n=1 Tax=Enterococcus sp. AZ102 TaxID=2774865 RepID=UPI003F1E5AF6